MQEKTFEKIHEAYSKATQIPCRLNPVAVEKELVRILSDMNIPDEDIQRIDYFLDKVEKSIQARKLTFKSTNLCTELLHTAMYIVIWANEQFNQEIDTNIIARRKSLESELAKELDLSDHLVPTQIKDRFGIRFVILNDDDAMSICCFLATKLLNVLCSLNRCDRKNFLTYIEKFDEDTQRRITKLLDIPFTLEPLDRADTKKFVPEEHPEVELPTEENREMVAHFKGSMKFYFDPKWNGYQSMHFILAIDTMSKILPGFQIELQFRTWKMHEYAENNIDASHDAHKEGVADYAKIFTLSKEELSQCSIRAFKSYKDSENDLDGIHFPKIFYNRRMNPESFEEE